MLDVENELLTKRTLRFTHVTWPKHLYVNMFFILSCNKWTDLEKYTQSTQFKSSMQKDAFCCQTIISTS